MKEIKSIGLIETLGMVGAVEAADAALKAANVALLGYEFNGAGYVVIKLTGDVAAVQAAVSSGGATAERLGNLVATHVIPRPDEQVIEREIKTPDNVPPFDPPKKESSPGPAPKAPVKPTVQAAEPVSRAEEKSDATPEAKAPEPKPAPQKPAPKPKAKPASKAPVKPSPKPSGKTKPKGKK